MEEQNTKKGIDWKKYKKDGIEFFKFGIIALLIVLPIRLFVAQPFIVSGDSMYPTFHNGQYLIIDELSYHLRAPKRGEVIVFHYPRETKKYLIKRIIGLPGEKVIINNGKVSIKGTDGNEQTLDESYINEPFNYSGTFDLNEGEYFTMGDNRNRSSDSRAWGVLPKKDIVGRTFLRLFPFSDATYLPGKIENK